jgi:hypothetical protein
VFNIRQKNVVTTDPGFLNYRQTGEVESKGAELSAISRPGQPDADCKLATRMLSTPKMINTKVNVQRKYQKMQ